LPCIVHVHYEGGGMQGACRAVDAPRTAWQAAPGMPFLSRRARPKDRRKGRNRAP
jgi:hypothetical protein